MPSSYKVQVTCVLFVRDLSRPKAVPLFWPDIENNMCVGNAGQKRDFCLFFVDPYSTRHLRLPPSPKSYFPAQGFTQDPCISVFSVFFTCSYRCRPHEHLHLSYRPLSLSTSHSSVVCTKKRTLCARAVWIASIFDSSFDSAGPGRPPILQSIQKNQTPDELA